MTVDRRQGAFEGCLCDRLPGEIGKVDTDEKDIDLFHLVGRWFDRSPLVPSGVPGKPVVGVLQLVAPRVDRHIPGFGQLLLDAPDLG